MYRLCILVKRQVSWGGFSCAWRFLTIWNYFPTGLKIPSLIRLLQHKWADMKGVSEATVQSMEDELIHVSAELFANIFRILNCHYRLAKFSPGKIPNTLSKQLLSIPSKQHFHHSTPVISHLCQLGERNLSRCFDLCTPPREETKPWKNTCAATRQKRWKTKFKLWLLYETNVFTPKKGFSNILTCSLTES